MVQSLQGSPSYLDVQIVKLYLPEANPCFIDRNLAIWRDVFIKILVPGEIQSPSLRPNSDHEQN